MTFLPEVPGFDVVVETDAVGAAVFGDDLHVENYHLSLNLTESLCTKGLERGRDAPDPSHISPLISPVDPHAALNGTTL